MTYDLNNALKELEKSLGNPERTVEILGQLADDVVIPETVLLESLESMSTTVEGATSGVLYSGWISADMYSGKAADKVASADSKIAIINNTDAFKLLDDDAFADAYKQANPKDYAELFDEAPRTGANSLWDDISRKFASGLEGNVMTITPNADARRVFAQTELPALLENSKVTKINGVDKVAYSGRYIQLTAQGASPEDAIARVNEELVKPSSLDFVKGYSTELADEVGLTPQHDFNKAAHDKLSYTFDMAADPAAYKGDFVAPVNKIAAEITENAPSSGSVLSKHGGTVVTAAIGTAVGVYTLGSGGSPAEAGQAFYETAVPYAEAQVNAAQGDYYDAMKAAASETMSNTAFTVCAVPGAVGGGVLGSPVPVIGTGVGAFTGGLITGTPCAVGAGMATEYAFDTVPVVAQATVDVAEFAGEQVATGASAVASSTMSHIDSAYDDWSGNTAQMHEIYDVLPVLETAANDDLYDTSVSDPIHNYPAAHDMALIKTQIVDTQNTIEQINQGTKHPFNGMNKAESADFLQGRIDRLNERFESTYDAAKSDGTLDEVTDYTTQYGVLNTDKAAQSLAIQNAEPAANRSWDAPKTRALAM